MKTILSMVLVMALGVAHAAGDVIPIPASSADSGARASITIRPVDLSNYVTSTQLGNTVNQLTEDITDVDGRVTTLNSNVVNNYATKTSVTNAYTNATNYTNTKYNSAITYTNTKYNSAINYTQDYAAGRIVSGTTARTSTSSGWVYVRGVCVGGRTNSSGFYPSPTCPSGSGFVPTETELTDGSTGP